MRPIYEDFSHVISPITGKIRFDGVQDLTEDYTWIGDSNDNAFQSPILIDIRLDLIELRTILDKTTPSGFILQTKNDILPNSQALDELSNGFLYNTHGILSSAIPGEGTIALPEGKVFVGDSNNLASAQQLISINNLPDLQANTIGIGPITYGIWEMWQGTNSGRPQASYSVSTTLAQIDFAFKSTNWIIGKSGIVPGALSYPEAQFLDQLPDNRILTHEGNGVIGVASLSFKKIFRGNASAVPEESNDLTTLEDKVTFIEDVKIPAIESEISTIEGQITAIEGQITFIEGEITLLQGAVVVLQGQVTALIASVASLNSRVSDLESDVSDLQTRLSAAEAAIVVIQGQITAINLRIDNLSATFVGDVQGSGLLSSNINLELMLTLDEIKKAQANVDLNNHKINKLISEDVEQLDALNAVFLWDLMHDNVGVVWV